MPQTMIKTSNQKSLQEEIEIVSTHESKDYVF